jgi:hypothetical protein
MFYIVTLRPKAGVVEPEQRFISVQRLIKHVPAEMKAQTHAYNKGVIVDGCFLFGPCKVVIRKTIGTIK